MTKLLPSSWKSHVVFPSGYISGNLLAEDMHDALDF